jgi:hypothetical protein
MDRIDAYANRYPNREAYDNSNVVSGRMLLTQLLICHINEKKDLIVKLRSERLKIQREMKEVKQS